jgi:uncharacterized protein (UPF0262 family)
VTTPGRIIALTLDDTSLAARSADLEMERHRAISDLLCENSFRLKEPDWAGGPYRLVLSLRDNRLIIDVGCNESGHTQEIALALSPLRRLILDYTAICDNFYKLARAGEMHRLEAVDMGRRGMHDEGAGILAESLEDKVILDKTTARRLFSLVYVLHARTITN